jgi:poly(A) polymerase
MNSSYNVSTSTLRVMSEQFASGNEICKVGNFYNDNKVPFLSSSLVLNAFHTRYSFYQGVEMKQAEWSSLFETYPFFEAYRNYLQIDIMAADDCGMRSWLGWVESRLRQLTLKVGFFANKL